MLDTTPKTVTPMKPAPPHPLSPKPPLNVTPDEISASAALREKVTIATEKYTKNTADDKTRGFLFTENLQAHQANRGRAAYDLFPETEGGPKLNVRAQTATGSNQAGIRRTEAGVRNMNAFSIISKKFQQSADGKWVRGEGQFQDNDSDFELFKRYNNEGIQEAIDSGLPLTMSVGGIATGKSALPRRFAAWLQEKVKSDLGIESTIIKNNIPGYEGFGLTNLVVTGEVLAKAAAPVAPGTSVAAIAQEKQSDVNSQASKMIDPAKSELQALRDAVHALLVKLPMEIKPLYSKLQYRVILQNLKELDQSVIEPHVFVNLREVLTNLEQLVSMLPSAKQKLPQQIAASTNNNVQVAIGRTMDAATGARDDSDTIMAAMKELYETALYNRTTLYTVPGLRPVAWNKAMLNGYNPVEMANLIAEMGPIPANIMWEPKLQEYINGLPGNYADDFIPEPQDTRLLQNMDQLIMKRQMNELFVPTVNEKGEQTGNFTPQRQLEATDTILTLLYSTLQGHPKMPAGEALVRVMYGMQDHILKLWAKSKSEKAENWAEVLASFAFAPQSGRASIASLVIQRLTSYGLTIKNPDALLLKLEVTKNAILTQQQPPDRVDMIMQGRIQDNDEAEDRFDLGDELTGDLATMIKDYDDSAFEMDPRDTASWRLKLFISSLERKKLVDVTGPDGKLVKRVISEKNYLGAPSLVNFDDVYEKIMGLLADKEPEYETYLQVLRQNVSTMPVLAELIKNLEGDAVEEIPEADLALKNEFVKVMTTHYQKYMMMTFNRSKDANGKVRWVLNPFEANRKSRVLAMIDSWQQAQKQSPIMTEKHGEKMIDFERVNTHLVPRLRILDIMLNLIPRSRKQKQDTAETKRLYEEARALIEIHHKLTLEKYMEFQDGHMRGFVMDLMRVNGVDFTKNMRDDLFTNMELHTRDTSLDGGIHKQFSFTAQGEPNGMFSHLVWKMAGKVRRDDDIREMDETKLKDSVKKNNPFYTEPTTMRILARIAANHTVGLTTASHRNSEGKTVFDYVLPTAMSQKMNEVLRSSDEDFEKLYEAAKNVKMTRHNYLLDHWMSNPNDRTGASVYVLDGMKAVWQKEGTTRGDMSDREQILDMIGMFQNRNKQTAHYVSLTHSDKTTSPILTNFPRMNTGGVQTDIRVYAAMYNVFLTEYERIRDHANVEFNHPKYQAGKHLFFKMPQFNYEYMMKTVAEGKVLINNQPMTKTDVDYLWISPTEIAPSINAEAKAVIRAMLANHVNDLTSATQKEWTAAGVINEKRRTYPFDSEYLYHRMTSSDYLGWRENRNDEDPSLHFWYNKDGREFTKNEVYRTVTTVVAREYAVNYFLVNTAMTDLVYGDPAQALKAKDEQLENGRVIPGQVQAVVNSTYVEYAKRLAKDIAPGQSFHWGKDEKTLCRPEKSLHYFVIILL